MTPGGLHMDAPHKRRLSERDPGTRFGETVGRVAECSHDLHFGSVPSGSPLSRKDESQTLPFVGCRVVNPRRIQGVYNKTQTLHGTAICTYIGVV